MYSTHGQDQTRATAAIRRISARAAQDWETRWRKELPAIVIRVGKQTERQASHQCSFQGRLHHFSHRQCWNIQFCKTGYQCRVNCVERTTQYWFRSLAHVASTDHWSCWCICPSGSIGMWARLTTAAEDVSAACNFKGDGEAGLCPWQNVNPREPGRGVCCNGVQRQDCSFGRPSAAECWLWMYSGIHARGNEAEKLFIRGSFLQMNCLWAQTSAHQVLGDRPKCVWWVAVLGVPLFSMSMLSV